MGSTEKSESTLKCGLTLRPSLVEQIAAASTNEAFKNCADLILSRDRHAARLGACYSGAVCEVLRAMGFSEQASGLGSLEGRYRGNAIPRYPGDNSLFGAQPVTDIEK